MYNVYLYSHDIKDEELESALIEGITYTKDALDSDKYFRVKIACNGSSLKASQKLSEVDRKLYLLSAKPFELVYDGVSAYYCSRLFPLLSKLERSLKELLYVVCYSSSEKDAQIERLIKDIDKIYFSKLLYSLKYDINFNNSLKKYLNERYRSKKEVFDYLKDHSENDSLLIQFGLANSTIANDTKRIIDIRNDVMHHHPISENKYSDSVSLLKNAIREITLAIKLYDKKPIKERNANVSALKILVDRLAELDKLWEAFLNGPGYKAFVDQSNRFGSVLSAIAIDTSGLEE